MEAWEGFFVAEVGAAAVLAGLIFVGISMNLQKLLERRLVSRAAWLCLLSLVEVLVMCSLMLIPEQSLTTLGLEIGVLGTICWAVITFFTVSQLARSGKEGFKEGQTWYAKLLIILLGQVITLPFVIAGILFLSHTETGAYWIAFGTLAALPYCLYMGWVLTVEVNR